MVHGSSTWINPPPWNKVIIKPVDIMSSAFHTDPWSQPGHQKLQRSELQGITCGSHNHRKPPEHPSQHSPTNTCKPKTSGSTKAAHWQGKQHIKVAIFNCKPT